MGNILLPPQYYVIAFLCGVCTWRFLEDRKHLDRNCQMSNKESIALSLAVMYLVFVISSTVLVRDATDLYSFDALNILALRNLDSGVAETNIPDTETTFDWLDYL